MSYQKLTAMHLKLDKKMFIRYYAIAKRRNEYYLTYSTLLNGSLPDILTREIV